METVNCCETVCAHFVSVRSVFSRALYYAEWYGTAVTRGDWVRTQTRIAIKQLCKRLQTGPVNIVQL
jgi:hypothetical protein